MFNGHERTTGSLSQLHLTAFTRRGPRLSLQLWKVNFRLFYERAFILNRQMLSSSAVAFLQPIITAPRPVAGRFLVLKRFLIHSKANMVHLIHIAHVMQMHNYITNSKRLGWIFNEARDEA